MTLIFAFGIFKLFLVLGLQKDLDIFFATHSIWYVL